MSDLQLDDFTADAESLLSDLTDAGLLVGLEDTGRLAIGVVIRHKLFHVAKREVERLRVEVDAAEELLDSVLNIVTPITPKCEVYECNRASEFEGWYRRRDFSGNETGACRRAKFCADHANLLIGWTGYATPGQ